MKHKRRDIGACKAAPWFHFICTQLYLQQRSQQPTSHGRFTATPLLYYTLYTMSISNLRAAIMMPLNINCATPCANKQ